MSSLDAVSGAADAPNTPIDPLGNFYPTANYSGADVLNAGRRELARAGSGIAGTLGGLVSGAGAAYESPWPEKWQAIKDAFSRSATQEQADYQKQGEAGTGIPGAVSNPVNAVAMLPGLEPARLATGLGISNPFLRAALSSGIAGGEGAALGGAQAAGEGTPVLPAAAKGALAAIAMNGVGQGLKNWGEGNFPGLSPLYNRNVTPEAKDLIRQNVEDILSRGTLPSAREGFLKLSAKEQQALGRKYQAATESVPEGWTYPVAQLGEGAQSALQERIAQRSAMEYLPGGPGIKPLAIIPADAAKVLGGKLGNVRGTQLAKSGNPEALTAKEIEKYRNDLTNPETYRDPVGLRAMLLKDVGKSFHSASNDALMGAPNYAKMLGADTPKKYALWSSLEDLIEHPGNLGLQHRLPVLNFAVDPWFWSSMLHKSGSVLQRAALPAAATAAVRGAKANGSGNK
jgi:hypothetical protein